MDIERVRRFIERAKGLKLSEEHQRLLGHFEEFVELQQLGVHMGCFKEKEFQGKLIRAHRQFWNAFIGTAAKHGISMDELKEKLLQAHRFRQDSVPSAEKKMKKISKHTGKVRV